MSFKPTDEQQATLKSYASGDSFKVEAVAGSGKTSTVRLMAESDEMKEALYLAFNKAAAEEASDKMPPHVTCKTTHSIAYAKFGAKYRDKLSRPRGGYVNVAGTVAEIKKYFNVQSTGSLNANAICRLAKMAVSAFEASSQPVLDDHFVSHNELEILARKAEVKGNIFDKASAVRTVTKVAKQLWQERIDLRSPVLITHDTYLKMYQLSEPHLDYDVIFLDEAQDTSDCVIDIVMRQKNHAQVVCVGDSYQAIYGWRGAVNALGKIKSQSTPLSQSFRYGPAVAEVATAILDSAMQVRGFDQIPTEVGTVDRSKPYTMLFRTNAALIDEGIELISQGVNVSMAVDIKGYVRKLEAAAKLFEGEENWKIKHEDICIFETWDELMEEADLVKGELARIANIVMAGEWEEVVRVLGRYNKPRNYDVELTTAHKSKGLEYNQVILANDFPDVIGEDGEYTELNDMERNLLYVAATRAQGCLQLNKTCRDIIKYREGGIDHPPTKCLEGLDMEVRVGYLDGSNVNSDAHIERMFNKVVGKETAAQDALINSILDNDDPFQ